MLDFVSVNKNRDMSFSFWYFEDILQIQLYFF